MAENLELGESVYTRADFGLRSSAPLHVAARQLAEMHSNGPIVDLGCSDGVTSVGLQGVSSEVIGLDASLAALKQYKKRNTEANLVCADITTMPFRENEGRPVTGLMLDVLEHVDRKEAIAVLGSLRKILNPDHQLIVSMPIISPLSINTWMELFQTLKKGRRPATGLFDRTHQILTDSNGHRRLFEEGGYEVLEDYRVVADGSVVGLGCGFDPVLDNANTDLLDKGAEASNGPRTRMLRAIRNGSYPQALEQPILRTIEYQGLYVLCPIDEAA